MKIQPDPAADVTARSWGDEELLDCPQCPPGAGWVHPVSVQVWPCETSSGTGMRLALGAGLLVTAAGVQLLTAPVTVRGVVITVEYGCEDGHRFAEVTHFHKGQTFRERVLRDS